jgi:hypothetical protein
MVDPEVFEQKLAQQAYLQQMLAQQEYLQQMQAVEQTAMSPREQSLMQLFGLDRLTPPQGSKRDKLAAQLNGLAQDVAALAQETRLAEHYQKHLDGRIEDAQRLADKAQERFETAAESGKKSDMEKARHAANKAKDLAEELENLQSELVDGKGNVQDMLESAKGELADLKAKAKKTGNSRLMRAAKQLERQLNRISMDGVTPEASIKTAKDVQEDMSALLNSEERSESLSKKETTEAKATAAKAAEEAKAVETAQAVATAKAAEEAKAVETAQAVATTKAAEAKVAAEKAATAKIAATANTTDTALAIEATRLEALQKEAETAKSNAETALAVAKTTAAESKTASQVATQAAIEANAKAKEAKAKANPFNTVPSNLTQFKNTLDNVAELVEPTSQLDEKDLTLLEDFMVKKGKVDLDSVKVDDLPNTADQTTQIKREKGLLKQFKTIYDTLSAQGKTRYLSVIRLLKAHSGDLAKLDTSKSGSDLTRQDIKALREGDSTEANTWRSRLLNELNGTP